MRGKKKRIRAESSIVAGIANQARKELSEYLIKNKLDPMMDWDEDPTHGHVTKRLNQIILFNEQKAKLMAKKEKDEKMAEKKKRLKKPEVMPEKVREVPKKQPRVYEYPQVDGRDMTSLEKKKYRQKMRVLMKTEMPIKEAQEKALKYCKSVRGEEGKPAKKAPKKEEKVKKEKVKDKKSKETKKKVKEEKPAKKKIKREED